jgi:NTP pyrophosphatase (non-canonical NTP hydrolase)
VLINIAVTGRTADAKFLTMCGIDVSDRLSVLFDQWIKEYGVRYFSELTNMACLTEEVGELARVMARKYGDQSFKEGEKSNLGDEMADILWVLMCLANQTGVDLTEEFSKNMDKKTQRDATRHKNNSKLKA